MSLAQRISALKDSMGILMAEWSALSEGVNSPDAAAELLAALSDSAAAIGREARFQAEQAFLDLTH